MTTPAGDDVAGSARIVITLDDTGTVADVQALGQRIERILNISTLRAARLMRRNLQIGLRNLSAAVRVQPDTEDFMARLRAALAGEEVAIRVVPDLSDFDARIRAHRPPDVTVNANVDTDRFSRALSGLAGVAGRVGGALAGLLRLGAVGIAAAGAAQGVVALGAALAPAAGILAAYPAAVAAVQVSMQTLRLAVLGVGDALSAALSGDAAAFQEALEKLAPAAQEAARAVRDLAPELREVQQAVQQAFFKQFASDVSTAITNLLPLRSQLAALAAEFGNAASAGLAFAASQQAVAPLQQIIQGTTQAASGLQLAIAPLAKGFLDIAAAVTQAFGPQVGTQIAQLGAQFGTWLSTLAASGAAVGRVRGAVAVFQQLGAIASNVGQTISGVFSAAGAAGGGFLGSLERITGAMRNFVNSASGQEAIGNLFATIGQIAAQLGPIFAALVQQVGAIAPALGPVLTSLGPAITGVINALGPAIAGIMPGIQAVARGLAQAFDGVGPALAPLGAAIGQILTALAPLLPVVGQLAAAFASALAPILAAITPLIAPIISAFQQFVPIITQLVSTLSAALLPVFSALVPVIAQLLAPVVQLGAAIGQALIPIIQALSPILTALAPALTHLALAFMPVVNVIVQLAPILTPIISLIGQLVAWVLRLITPLVQLVAPIVTVIAQFFAINRAIGTVIGWLGRLVGWFGTLGTRISSMASTVGSAISRVIGFFSSMFSRVSSVVTSLASRVPSAFTSLMSRAGSAVSSGISRVVSFFSGLWGRLSGVLSSLGGRVVSFFSGLLGRIRSTLSSAGSLLVSVGRALVSGLIRGIRAMASSAASAARSVVSGTITAAKDALGISSPSKVFTQIGKDTGAGFIKGLTGSAADIKKTTDKIAASIRNAFKGKKSKLDDRLLKLVADGNKRLTKLANQRDAIAKKIADAQKFATDTAASALQSFSLQNIAGQGDGTIASLTEGLDQALASVSKYNRQINSLAKRGLRKDLLQQLIALGPQQGAQLAATLSRATGSQLRQINNLQGQLASATTKFGRDSADILYDAGKNAGKGFLAGLKGQQKDIEKLMLDIAKRMQKSIRKALGIKSPSRVFARIGDQTGQGLQIGLLGRLADVEASARSAAQSLAGTVAGSLAGMDGGTSSLRLTAAPTTPRTSAQAPLGRFAADTVQRQPVTREGANITFNVTAQNDAEATARLIMRRLASARLA